MIGHHIARGQAARNGIDRRQPAMGLAFQEMRAGIAERFRQRFDRRVDQFLVAEIGEGQRVGSGDQPVQHTMPADIVPRTFDVDAAAAEGFGHPPRARNLVAPERLIEQDRHPQVMRRAVEIGNVLYHRMAQQFAVPAHRGEPRVRQAHHNQIVFLGDRPLAVHHVDGVAAGIRLADLQNPVVQLDVGFDFTLQAMDELLVAILDRVEADIALHIHHKVLQGVEPVGVVRLGGDVRARHHFQETLRNRIGNFAVQQLLGADVRPRMLVVVRADAFIVFGRRHHLGAQLAEILDRLRGLLAVFAAHAGNVVEQFAVKLNLLGVHRNGLQSEMLDQFAQRVGTRHRVVVDFGDARLVHRRRGVEFFRQYLTADAIRCLVNGDTAKRPKFLLEVPSAHQPAWATANYCQIEHDVLRPSPASHSGLEPV